jgi:hypothetical protein
MSISHLYEDMIRVIDSKIESKITEHSGSLENGKNCNLNLLTSQVYKGKSANSEDIHRFFPAGVVFHDEVLLKRVTLTTTPAISPNVKHILKIIQQSLTSNNLDVEQVFEKHGTSIAHAQILNKNIKGIVSFQLDCVSGNTPTPFTGEATLTLEIII